MFSRKTWTGFCSEVDAECRLEKSLWASMVSSVSWSCRHRMVRSIP